MTLRSDWGQIRPGDRGMTPLAGFVISQHLTSSEAQLRWSWRGDSNPQPPIYKVRAEGPLPSADI